MLDSDLAKIYGVIPKRLNEQVRSNIHRFPSDFAFLLTKEELEFRQVWNAIDNLSKPSPANKRQIGFDLN